MTPTRDEERQNDAFDAAHDYNAEDVDAEDVENLGDLSDLHFDTLYSGGLDYDWSVGYDETYESILDTYSSAYYQNDDENDNVNSTLQLFEEHLYCPENCKGHAQMILVGNHILKH